MNTPRHCVAFWLVTSVRRSGCSSQVLCWTTSAICTDVIAVNGNDADATYDALPSNDDVDGGDDQVCFSLPSRRWSDFSVHGGRRQPKTDTLRLSARNQEQISGHLRGQVRVTRL